MCLSFRVTWFQYFISSLSSFILFSPYLYNFSAKFFFLFSFCSLINTHPNSYTPTILTSGSFLESRAVESRRKINQWFCVYVEERERESKLIFTVWNCCTLTWLSYIGWPRKYTLWTRKSQCNHCKFELTLDTSVQESSKKVTSIIELLGPRFSTLLKLCRFKDKSD